MAFEPSQEHSPALITALTLLVVAVGFLMLLLRRQSYRIRDLQARVTTPALSRSNSQDRINDIISSYDFDSSSSNDISKPITLIGAGLGDPNLLTVGALRALQSADVVVADRLITPAILKLCRGRVYVAKKLCGRANVAQEEIYDECINAAKQGLKVVRLKGGDPFVFGRGGEEVLRFRQHGFGVSIIPGISSSIAAPACGGIPLTVRGIADSFVVATAHGKNGSEARLPTYVPHRTVVLLMGVSRMAQMAAKLVDATHDFPATTPVGIVERASRPDQRVTKTTLADVTAVAKAKKIAAPAVIVIGEVVNCLD
eukprot:TRINITY_DN1025_c0_g1_i2.p1 TRINITY_DN1025_c0_g1~~TRINITY_DN1025_c0_g1_i2.p1  ORF type:complete len:331 (+),score=39.07 TRINITY_DN1025_c0_g1_i2:57-995(+)